MTDPEASDDKSAQEQLLRYADDLRRTRATQRSLTHRLAPSRDRPHQILIVDDDENIRLLVSVTLGVEEFVILEAGRGVDCLAMARDHRPSLIILDLNLPDISGMDVCKALRVEPTLHDVPIIVLTGSGYGREKEGLEAGVNVYLTKPFSPEQLLEAVDQLLLERPETT